VSQYIPAVVAAFNAGALVGFWARHWHYRRQIEMLELTKIEQMLKDSEPAAEARLPERCRNCASEAARFSVVYTSTKTHMVTRIHCSICGTQLFKAGDGS
jgi:hypothetical protein